MPLQRIFQAFRKLLIVTFQLEKIFDNQEPKRLDQLEIKIGEIRERLARLEATREADRIQAQAELSLFKSEAERTQLRFIKTKANKFLLPPS